MEVAESPETESISFDICRYGMHSPAHHYPVKKRTKLMTNVAPVVERFGGVPQVHKHVPDEGRLVQTSLR